MNRRDLKLFMRRYLDDTPKDPQEELLLLADIEVRLYYLRKRLW